MGKIFYVMGKSASGKDAIYSRLRELEPSLKAVIPYTTRPIRDGETEGVEYRFTDEKELARMKEQGNVIEMRTYRTVFGPWSYATVNDGQIDLQREDYLMIGTLESYLSTRRYFGESAVIPIYIEVENGERLARALERERRQKEPKYTELCRRYIADEEDFCEDRLRRAGLEKRYENRDFESCLGEILETVRACRQ